MLPKTPLESADEPSASKPTLTEMWATGHKKHVAEREKRIGSALRCLKRIVDLVPFDNVIDVGCGIGAWLHAANQLGAKSITGLEGEWINNSEVLIDRKLIQIVDLASSNLDFRRSFDLAMSIEVAEHLPESSADTFVKVLTRASGYVLFSAAIPGQGGNGHINEQPLPYWVEKFWREHFVPLEVIRPYISEDRSIQPWLRQNLVLFVDYAEFLRNDRLRPFARPLGDFGLRYNSAK